MAQTTNPGGDNGGNTPIGATESVNCDELTDEQKKEMAKEAYDHLAAAEKLLKEMAKIITEDIYPDNGACHFVYARDWGFLGDIAEWTTNTAADVAYDLGADWESARYQNSTANQDGTELTFSDNAKKGAQFVDEVLTAAEEPSGKAVSIIDHMESSEYQAQNGEKEGLKSITDWDMRGVYEKAKRAIGQAEQLYNWAKDAPNFSYKSLDRVTSNLICQHMGCPEATYTHYGSKADECDRIYIHSDGHIVCFDEGDLLNVSMSCDSAFKELSTTCRKNGKSYTCAQGLGIDKSNCWAAMAATWSSANPPEEFKHKVIDKTKTCLDKLRRLAEIRGDPSTKDTFIWHRKEAKHRLAMLSGETECTCSKDDKGEITAYCMDEAEDEDNKGKDCKTISEYQAELSNTCPTCDLLATVAAAAQQISQTAFSIANDLVALLSIGLLIYIAYITLITIGSPEAQKTGKYLTTILIQGFKVALTIAVLQNPSFLYKEALGPILDGSVDFSMSLISTNAGEASSAGAAYASKFDGNNDYLDAKTLQNLVGVAVKMNGEVAMMPAIGRALICRSFDPKGMLQKIAAHFVPFPYQFAMFVEGIIIYIFGLMILLALISYMLDCIIELGFVCAIIPFCAACWPFKITSNYTKVGWNMFLNVFFNFVMLGVVVATITNLAVQSVSGGMTKDEFVALVNGDSIEALTEQMSIGGMQMLIVLACSMICLKMPKEIGRLANKFAGGAQISVGSELAGAAAQVATKTAIGNGLQKGQDGKRHLGGAAGLLAKGASKAGGSIAEHTGLKGAASAAGKAISNKAKGALGRVGLGSKAKMASKGRDQGANKNTDTSSGFKQDR